MLTRPSIAFVSGSRPTDGIFLGNYQVYRAAAELGFVARWIQCIDPSDREGQYSAGSTVVGRRLPVRSLELGVNRLWTFPAILRKLPEGRIFLGDPTFLRIANKSTASKLIVHVHDLRPLSEHRDRWDTQLMFRYAIPRLRNVRRIMVHTEYVRDLLEEVAGVRDRVYVLPPHSELPDGAAELHVRAARERQAREGGVHIVYIATDRPYKNLRFFFELARSLEDYRSPRFHFTLVSRLSHRSAKDLEQVRPKNITVIPFASDLAPIYECADILAFPSLYEGFGLPVLEALSYGIPVVANDIRVMHEVAGPGATFVPIGAVMRWKEALLRLADPVTYAAASSRAIEQSRLYSRERFQARVPELFA